MLWFTYDWLLASQSTSIFIIFRTWPTFCGQNLWIKKTIALLPPLWEDRNVFRRPRSQPLKIKHNHLFIDNWDFLLRLGQRIFGHWTGRWAWAWVRGLIEAKYRDIDPLCVVNFRVIFLLSLFVCIPWQNGKMFPFFMEHGNQRPIWPIRLKPSIR